MSNADPTNFTHDLYPGLDAELDAAFSGGSLMFEQDAAAEYEGLQTAMKRGVREIEIEIDKSEALQWANSQLPADGDALLFLGHLEPQLGQSVPHNLQELLTEYPQHEEQIYHLYSANEKLRASGEKTQRGVPIGDDMRLAMVPWQFFRENLDNLESTIELIRRKQGLSPDHILNSQIYSAIIDKQKMYRNSEQLLPEFWETAEDYLSARITTDGPWGLMLAQAHGEAGTAGASFSADTLTRMGDSRAECAGVAIDAMGIFEWLSLTLQFSTDQLRKYKVDEASLLLANRYAGRTTKGEPDPRPYVPIVEISSNSSAASQFLLTQIHTSKPRQNCKPRLAVL